MRRELLSLGLTAILLLSLLAFAQPTAAVLTTVDGPDEVQKPDTIVFDTSVQIREDERLPIESFNLVLETDEGETVTVTFAPDGTVLSIEPAEGVVGEGDIHIEQLNRSLEITPVESNADFGYGYGYGTDERTGETETFGYGYGYGYGDAQPSFGFQVEMTSTAFRPGDYTVQLSINADGEEGLFASNEKGFEVGPPSDGQRGPPDDLPAQAADRANQVQDVIRQVLNGALDGPIGHAIQDLAGAGDAAEGEDTDDDDDDSNGNGQGDDRRGGSSNGQGGR